MFQRIKRFFYFPVAWYFRFFAGLRLKKWNPRIIVITGSSGKTTLLNLIESQLGQKARYSHEANSSFGIPFDILEIHRKDLTLVEWPKILILPWINLFKPFPQEKIYVVEADCDRPYEGKFLSSLLNPEVVLWTNVSRTHSMNFDELVEDRKFKSVEEAIAFEFGNFLERTKNLAIVNADNPLEKKQSERAICHVEKVSVKKELKRYEVGIGGTSFYFNFGTIGFRYLLPEETAESVLMAKKLTEYLGIEFKKTFPGFRLPPGRSSIFEGIKNVTIVDSSYNTNFDSMKAIIKMFTKIRAEKRWLVIGDMLEQGINEKVEHEKLAKLISDFSFQKIILLGPRVSEYTRPMLTGDIESFLSPKDVLTYLQNNINGKEVILFKGARFLEGVIESLLVDKSDAKYLSRREKIWEIRRKKWGL